MSAEVIRLADRGRPFRPHPVDDDKGWFEREMHAALVRIGMRPAEADEPKEV